MSNLASTSLDQMHDIVLPPPPAWWPPAEGWWVVAAVIGIWACWQMLMGFRRWQHQLYRREALAALHDLRGELTAVSEDRECQRLLVEVATLLRRTALSVWPREEIASLSGEAWHRFLNQHGDHFSHDATRLLEQAVYEPEGVYAVDREAAQRAIEGAIDWVKHHRADGSGEYHQHDMGREQA